MFTTDELRDIVHRTRTVERVHSDEVAHDGRFELLHVLAHTQRLKLEYTYRASLLEQFVGIGIFDGDMVDIHLFASCFLDILEAFLDDSQSLKSQEVHLDQSNTFDHMTVILCHQDTLT